MTGPRSTNSWSFRYGHCAPTGSVSSVGVKVGTGGYGAVVLAQVSVQSEAQTRAHGCQWQGEWV
jgi:hypothetical protein